MLHRTARQVFANPKVLRQFLDPETVQLLAFSILSAMFTGVYGPPEKLSLRVLSGPYIGSYTELQRLFGSRNSPTTSTLHTIRHVYRSVWPAREAKPRFGAVLSAHDYETRSYCTSFSSIPITAGQLETEPASRVGQLA